MIGWVAGVVEVVEVVVVVVVVVGVGVEWAACGVRTTLRCDARARYLSRK